MLYVPKLACNLFSVRAAAHKGNNIKFRQSRCWVRSKYSELCSSGSLVGKLYQLNCRPSTKITEHASTAAEHGSINLWHQRLGHISKSRLETILSKKEPVLTGLNLPTTSGLSLSGLYRRENE